MKVRMLSSPLGVARSAVLTGCAYKRGRSVSSLAPAHGKPLEFRSRLFVCVTRHFRKAKLNRPFCNAMPNAQVLFEDEGLQCTHDPAHII
jgi:hypothetical protein